MRLFRGLIILSLIIVPILSACSEISTPTRTYTLPKEGPERTPTKKPTIKKSPTKAPTKSPEATPTNSYYALATVTANLCNLRQGPGTNFPIVGSTANGEVLKIYGANIDRTWLLLDKKQSIWIALSLVLLDSDISEIPVIEELSMLEDYEPPGGEIQPTIIYSSPTNIILQPTQSIQTPEPTEFAGCPNGCTFHPPGCHIKGNISYATQEKIYHVPGGEFYDDCVINPDYGERWFCTEQEAINNGWRKSEQ